ncbi:MULTISPECIES: hypothetical protein [unclassified Haladaptatus]|uniref:hypothetical protein n=1 Tax=unclassified Haladaptatus TaxID=2622732 RepID=UPI0023E76C67|nr:MULTISPECIES: hypothetical protein [unclassified Haladaptatus]
MLATLSVESIKLEDSKFTNGEPVFTIIAEVPSGLVMRLYEADHLHIHWIRPNITEICVFAHPIAGVKRRSTVTPHIERPAAPMSEWSYDLYGTIAKVNVSDPHSDREGLYLLDVGEGTILVDSSLSEFLPASEPSLSVGDALFIPTSRVDIYEDQPLRC